VRADGRCWLGDTRWRGRPMLRVSMANWQTTPAHVADSAAAIVAAVQATRGRTGGPRVRRCAGRAGVGAARRRLQCGR
jgi:hypothetical protein